MASDVVGLASGLGIRTFHAAGISMGGMIAQVLAARYPESVLSLTSMSSATGNPRTGLGKFSAIWATIRPQSRLTSESEGVKRLDRFIRAMGSVCYERTDAEKRRLVRLMARNPGDPDGFRRQLLALLQSGDRRTQVSGIRVPTLVLHGLSDKLLPPRAGKETAAGTEAKLCRVEWIFYRTIGRRLADETTWRGRRILTFGQTVDAVVQQNHVQVDVTAYGVDEVITADGQTVTVAGDLPYRQVGIGNLGTCRDGSSTSVDGLHRIRIHVIGQTAGAADT